MGRMHPLRTLSLADLRGRSSMKWREYGPEVLPLWVAEMDAPIAEPIARALHNAVDAGDTGYPSGTGYAEAWASFAADRWGWDGLDPGRTTLVADVMTGIVETIGLISSPGDPVVVSPPVYPPFFGFLAHAGRAIVEAPLAASGRLDPAALELAFERSVGAGRRVTYLLCNPQNPTGVVHTRDELQAVADLARRYDVRVVVDEIHAPLVSGDVPFTPYLSVDGAENAFSVLSASKAWNLAGIKAAVVVCDTESASDLARMPEVVSHGPSHFGVIAHTAGLNEGREWLDALRADVDANRVQLSELIARELPAVDWRPSYGTYLAWLDCRRAGLGDDPAATFLEHGVALVSGLDFGTGGAGHVRLNYGTTPEILEAAVARMAHATAAL